MKKISFALGTMIALVLFEAFGSVGVTPKASVSADVTSMHAVLPNGALVAVSTRAASNTQDAQPLRRAL
jgi:hypothetical protein